MPLLLNFQHKRASDDSESFGNMAIPKEQKALVIQEGQTLKIEKIPVPKLTKDNEILIKVGVAPQFVN